jgi:hypothetical protein
MVWITGSVEGHFKVCIHSLICIIRGILCILTLGYLDVEWDIQLLDSNWMDLEKELD